MTWTALKTGGNWLGKGRTGVTAWTALKTGGNWLGRGGNGIVCRPEMGVNNELVCVKCVHKIAIYSKLSICIVNGQWSIIKLKLSLKFWQTMLKENVGYGSNRGLYHRLIMILKEYLMCPQFGNYSKLSIVFV